ncbi:unnamed protein product [Ectocarpus sp. 4 AP-2014]
MELGGGYEEPSSDDDGEPSRASNGRYSGIAPDGLAADRDRVEAQLCVDQEFPDVDENVNGGEDMGWDGGAVGAVPSDYGYDVVKEQYDGGVDSISEQHQQVLEPAIEPDGGSVVEDTPLLENLHAHALSYAASSTLEGGPENLRYSASARGSAYYPFRTKEHLHAAFAAACNVGDGVGRKGEQP